MSSKGEEVALGQTIRTNDYEKKCIINSNGDVKYSERTLVGGFSQSGRPALQPDLSQPPGGHGTSYWEMAPESLRGKIEGGKCVQNGKTFNVGDEWVDDLKKYKYHCNADGLKPIGKKRVFELNIELSQGSRA